MKVKYPGFSTSIGYNPRNKKKPFYLDEDAIFIVTDCELAKAYRIPQGFKSDGCTIKSKLLQILLGCQHTPEYVIGAFIHDYFCNNKAVIKRNYASRVFYCVLVQEGTPKWKAKLMYFGVEFYQKYWNRWD